MSSEWNLAWEDARRYINSNQRMTKMKVFNSVTWSEIYKYTNSLSVNGPVGLTPIVFIDAGTRVFCKSTGK